MTRDEVIAMAYKADFDGWLRRVMLMAPEVLERFAALVAAGERRHFFDCGDHLDGEMRLEMCRWSGGQRFVSATHFAAADTRFGTRELVVMAAERMDDELKLAIRARGAA